MSPKRKLQYLFGERNKNYKYRKNTRRYTGLNY